MSICNVKFKNSILKYLVIETNIIIIHDTQFSFSLLMYYTHI